MRPTQEFAFWTKNPARAYSSRVYFLVKRFWGHPHCFCGIAIAVVLGQTHRSAPTGRDKL